MSRIKRYTGRISVHVTPNTVAWFKGQSEKENRPVSELYREALEKYQRLMTALAEQEAPQVPEHPPVESPAHPPGGPEEAGGATPPASMLDPDEPEYEYGPGGAVSLKTPTERDFGDADLSDTDSPFKTTVEDA